MSECEFPLCRRDARWEVTQRTAPTQRVCDRHVEVIVTWGAPDPEQAIADSMVRMLLRRSQAA